MMTEDLTAALMHAAKGCFPDQDVPVGLYNLSGFAVVVTLPDGAAVERGDGTAGGGFDSYNEKQKVLTLAVVTRFLEQAGLTGPAHKDAWVRAILDVFTAPIRPADQLPDEALVAAREVEGFAPVGLTCTRKTAAKRLGIKTARVRILNPSEAAALHSAPSAA